MKFYFGGGELRKWRELLIAQSVDDIAVSYAGLVRQKHDSVWFADNFDGKNVFLDSGAYTLNKEGSEYTLEDAEIMRDNYYDLASYAISDVSFFSEFDAKILPLSSREQDRKELFSKYPDKFMPIWHATSGADELHHMCKAYPRIGVTKLGLHDTSLIPLFNTVIRKYEVRLHGAAITSKEMMREVAWDSVSSTSWLSTIKFGDTFVWDGKDLKRYPKSMKDRARRTHRALFDKLGLNYSKIQDDDTIELLKLSIWSWQQFVDSLSGVTNKNMNERNFQQEVPATGVDIVPFINRNAELVKRDTVSLPVFGKATKTEYDDDGNETVTDFVIRRTESNRICRTCFLREKCPAFQEDSNCAYNIPIEIRTKEQLHALQLSLIEMQTQRVAFMQYSEDLEGGYADPNLSSELDRLNKMIKNKQDAEKDRFSMTVDVTSTNPNSGFMQRVFGSEAVTRLREIEPVKADDLMKDADIVDAELVN